MIYVLKVDAKMIHPPRLERILSSLKYDFRHFTMADFIARIEGQTGRRIHFVSWAMPRKVFGAWTSGPDEDYIFFSERLPPLLQNHVQLHEIAHILCGHKTTTIEKPQDLERVGLLLRSSTHDDPQEHEAEWLAGVIQAEVIRFNLIHELSVSISGDTKMVDLLRSLRIA